MSAPVYGLVLTGGQSARMGRDKASLTYHGRTQLEWAMDLIKPYVEKAFVSVRPGQNDPVRALCPPVSTSPYRGALIARSPACRRSLPTGGLR